MNQKRQAFLDNYSSKSFSRHERPQRSKHKITLLSRNISLKDHFLILPRKLDEVGKSDYIVLSSDCMLGFRTRTVLEDPFYS